MRLYPTDARGRALEGLRGRSHTAHRTCDAWAALWSLLERPSRLDSGAAGAR